MIAMKFTMWYGPDDVISGSEGVFFIEHIVYITGLDKPGGDEGGVSLHLTTGEIIPVRETMQDIEERLNEDSPDDPQEIDNERS